MKSGGDVKEHDLPFVKPETRFTKAGSVAIAYQVVGDGPIDLVYASGWLHNIDVVWENAGYRGFLRRLASFCRLILFDKRGTGMSDRDVGAPTLEDRAEDIRAVMDAVRSDSATIFGVSEGSHMTTMFAATYPERTRSIILIGTRPCIAWKPDWPDGWRRSEFNEYLQHIMDHWGEPIGLDRLAPSLAADPQEQAFFARLLTHSASPSSAAQFTRLWYEMDVRSILPSISCPALILRRTGDMSVSRNHSQYFADNIPNSRFIELEGVDHLPWAGDPSDIIEESRRFALAMEEVPREDRVLLSVLMTDIVESTVHALRMGDAAWRQLIAAHDAAATKAVARHEGKLIKSTGDGMLATFSGPSRAIACATELQRTTAPLGVTIRSGLHTGECLRHGQDVTGLAVTIAARIVGLANGGEIWVSNTVRDLVVGSGLRFDDLGTHALKGVPGQWSLARVAS